MATATSTLNLYRLAYAGRAALQWAMPELTRRRYPERQDCWHVYFGDVRVGTIARRIGQPHDEDRWGWDCGFYPGLEPGEQHQRHRRDVRKSALRI